MDAIRRLPKREQERLSAADLRLRRWLSLPWTMNRSRSELPNDPTEAVLWTRSVLPGSFPHLLEAPWLPLGAVGTASKEEPVTAATEGLPRVAVLGTVGVPDDGLALQVPPLSAGALHPDAVGRWSGGNAFRPEHGAAGLREASAWWASLSPTARGLVGRRMRADVASLLEQEAVAGEKRHRVLEEAAHEAPWRPHARSTAMLPYGNPPATPTDLAERVSLLWVGLTPADALDHYRVPSGIVLDLTKMPLYGAFPWRTAAGNTGYVLVLPAHARHVVLSRTTGTVREEAKLRHGDARDDGED
mgnify:CR=1 FL=1